MHRPDELDPDLKAFDPADQALDRVEPFELYPHMLIEFRTLDELELTAVRRDIVDVDPIGVLTGAPKRNIRVERNPIGPALVQCSKRIRRGVCHSGGMMSPQR